ncbi:MAG TPA: hypothetical protein VMV93_14040, partial [Chloroflexota bacterium]|nr:hypothetical protein [Chloroflexota bacterium]
GAAVEAAQPLGPTGRRRLAASLPFMVVLASVALVSPFATLGHWPGTGFLVGTILALIAVAGALAAACPRALLPAQTQSAKGRFRGLFGWLVGGTLEVRPKTCRGGRGGVAPEGRLSSPTVATGDRLRAANGFAAELPALQLLAVALGWLWLRASPAWQPTALALAEWVVLATLATTSASLFWRWRQWWRGFPTAAARWAAGGSSTFARGGPAQPTPSRLQPAISAVARAACLMAPAAALCVLLADIPMHPSVSLVDIGAAGLLCITLLALMVRAWMAIIVPGDRWQRAGGAALAGWLDGATLAADEASAVKRQRAAGRYALLLVDEACLAMLTLLLPGLAVPLLPFASTAFAAAGLGFAVALPVIWWPRFAGHLSAR